MEAEEKEVVEAAVVEEEEEEEEEKEEVDLFGNKRRRSLCEEGARRASLGLPDNGAGLTKDYYNIDRPMSITSLVDLIVLRRTGNEDRPRRRSTQLSQDLEERIKKTLAWKEMEDELNKEDVMVNFRKKMRELRKEARQSIPKETKIERKINEERRIQLRTSLLEPDNRRRSTTESVKEAIQEFRTRPPAIVEEPQPAEESEEDREATDILQKTRELLEQMGYLRSENREEIRESSVGAGREERPPSVDTTGSHESRAGPSGKKRKGSQSGSEKSLSGNTRPKTSKSRTSNLGRTSQEPVRHYAQRNLSTESSSYRPARTTKSSARVPRPDPLRPDTSDARRQQQSEKISSGQIKPPLSQRT